MPTVDILIVTFHRDAEFLDYSLRSIGRFVRGFRETVVVCPTRDRRVLAPVCARHPVRPVWVEEVGDGHLFQNIVKTEADLHTDADFILHQDSDTLFVEPFSPEDCFTDGKPDLFFAPYGDKYCPRHVPWRAVTEHALGFPVEVETMRRFPIVYPRALYSETRRRIEQVHEKSFREFVWFAPRLAGAWHAYSEFNALGCMGYYRHPEWFKLRRFGNDADARPWKHRQFDGPGGVTPEVRGDLEQIVGKVQHAA